MAVTTKIGDKGRSLYQGKMVDKDSPLLETIGELDELQAILGIVKLESIQNDLYQIMATLKVDKNEIELLENKIEKLEKELGDVNKFLVFKNETAVKINWARTVCRRVERRLVTLNKVQLIDLNILKYINRLSDYLFVLAREAEVR